MCRDRLLKSRGNKADMKIHDYPSMETWPKRKQEDYSKYVAYK